MAYNNKLKDTYIEGFKDHRGYFDLIDDIKKLIVKSSLQNQTQHLFEGIKQLIIETCPYNRDAVDNLKDLKHKYTELTENFDVNNKIKGGKKGREKYKKDLIDFVNFCEEMRVRIYPKLSKAYLMPHASEEVELESDKETDPEKRQQLKDLEAVGLN